MWRLPVLRCSLVQRAGLWSQRGYAVPAQEESELLKGFRAGPTPGNDDLDSIEALAAANGIAGTRFIVPVNGYH